MKHTRVALWLLFLVAGGALAATPAQDAAPEARDTGGGAGTSVFQIAIDGTIDLGLAAFVERAAQQAKAGDTILMVIKTFGGRVDAAVRIRDALLNAKATTVAFVDQRAISAGALIALASDTLLMSPGASIGAATPVQGGAPGAAPEAASEKVVSYMRAEIRTTAETKGRPGNIAEAMVDPDIAIEGVTEKGKLLTLTSQRAVELKIADAIVDNLEAVYIQRNLQSAKRVELRTHWAEKLARFLTDPTVSSLLMTFGFLGLLMELYTPGFGVGGLIGIVCLLLFFGGQYAANLAGWEELLLFVLGMALLLVEILLIPGFGITGIAGLVLMGAALIMALGELTVPLDVALDLGYLQEMISSGSLRLVILAVVLGVAVFILSRYFSTSPLTSWLVLRESASQQEGFVSPPASDNALVGQHGVTLSALRPAGLALIAQRRVDVVSLGDYIEANVSVEVVRVDGNRVVVKRLS